MIYLPLLFLGIEKIFKKEKPYLYIVMIFISAMSSFYFFYMLGIMVLIYAAVRFFALFRNDRLKYFFKWLFQFAMFTLVGILMAAVIFLPVIISVLGTQRFDTEIMIETLYDMRYYSSLMKSQVIAGASRNWSVIGHTSLTLVALALMFVRRKRYQQLKAAYIIAIIILFVPYLGHVMNGFSYVSNRWVFGYAFLMSLILCVMAKEILTMKKREAILVSGILGIYLLVSILFSDVREGAYYISMLICAAFLAYVLLTRYVQPGRYNTVRIRSVVMFAFMALNIIIQAMYLYSPDERDYISQYQDQEEVYSVMNRTPSTTIKKVDDETFYRYEADEAYSDRYRHNSAMLQEVHTTSYYFSLASGTTSELLNDFLLENTQGFQYYGLEQRAQLETLANVKYYVIDRQTGRKADPPYGYEKIAEMDGYDIYENTNALPFGYTYSGSISTDTYEELNPVERQQAAMQAVLLEDDDLFENTEAELETTGISYSIECEDGIEMEDNKIVVKDTSAVAYLVFDDEIDAGELYLYFENLYFDPIRPIERYSQEEWEALSVYKQKSLESADSQWLPEETASIKGWSGSGYSKVIVETPSFSWYKSQHDFLMNLNYSEGGRTRIKLKFSEIGEYSYDNISVIMQSMDELPAQAEALSEDALEDVIFDTDRVTGTIALDQSKVLCMTIPYSDGWTAYVNGEEQELIRVNTMYSGLVLDAGEYDIELVYRTPGIRAGVICSVVGGILFIGIMVFYSRRKKRNISSM